MIGKNPIAVAEDDHKLMFFYWKQSRSTPPGTYRIDRHDHLCLEYTRLATTERYLGDVLKTDRWRGRIERIYDDELSFDVDVFRSTVVGQQTSDIYRVYNWNLDADLDFGVSDFETFKRTAKWPEGMYEPGRRYSK
jgi:hypothetical protein